MLSNTAHYALRAVLVLARHEGTRPLRAEEIADAIDTSRNYTAEILNALARAGLLTSARGPLGGYALAVRPDTLTVAHVVDLFDEPPRISKCLLGRVACDPAAPCVAHRRWSAVAATRRRPLTSTSIADLLDGTPAGEAPAASDAA
jgi:Rrf2 family protein